MKLPHCKADRVTLLFHLIEEEVEQITTLDNRAQNIDMEVPESRQLRHVFEVSKIHLIVLKPIEFNWIN